MHSNTGSLLLRIVCKQHQRCSFANLTNDSVCRKLDRDSHGTALSVAATFAPSSVYSILESHYYMKDPLLRSLEHHHELSALCKHFVQLSLQALLTLDWQLKLYIQIARPCSMLQWLLSKVPLMRLLAT
eukprot:7352-Heterococcus_DN1.PRE.2